MITAQLITIGTEITSGEVINSNAAWVAQRLEELGVRVYNHLSVNDQREEILTALKDSSKYQLIVVTGGLGPTSDDITRDCLASYTGQALEFDSNVYSALIKLYEQRGLKLREAHKQQCHFPKTSERLNNPVGTALGFAMKFENRQYFVLPGPPRELEGVWNLEVIPRLQRILPFSDSHWVKWTCLGLPESEVAELVEKAIAGADLEVGYRAAVPYVKVKVYADRTNPGHGLAVSMIEKVLAPYTVGRGHEDLARELLTLWPRPELTVWDFVSESHLSSRLFSAQRELNSRSEKYPNLNIHAVQTSETLPTTECDIEVRKYGDEFIITMRADGKIVNEKMSLPYKVGLSGERGKRSAAEWVLWTCVKALRAS
jgi:molybdenum cofactor synthesis domain-containing protein